MIAAILLLSGSGILPIAGMLSACYACRDSFLNALMTAVSKSSALLKDAIAQRNSLSVFISAKSITLSMR